MKWKWISKKSVSGRIWEPTVAPMRQASWLRLFSLLISEKILVESGVSPACFVLFDAFWMLFCFLKKIRPLFCQIFRSKSFLEIHFEASWPQAPRAPLQTPPGPFGGPLGEPPRVETSHQPSQPSQPWQAPVVTVHIIPSYSIHISYDNHIDISLHSLRHPNILSNLWAWICSTIILCECFSVFFSYASYASGRPRRKPDLDRSVGRDNKDEASGIRDQFRGWLWSVQTMAAKISSHSLSSVMVACFIFHFSCNLRMASDFVLFVLFRVRCAWLGVVPVAATAGGSPIQLRELQPLRQIRIFPNRHFCFDL